MLSAHLPQVLRAGTDPGVPSRRPCRGLRLKSGAEGVMRPLWGHHPLRESPAPPAASRPLRLSLLRSPPTGGCAHAQPPSRAAAPPLCAGAARLPRARGALPPANGRG